jgi:hypothetical protein
MQSPRVHVNLQLTPTALILETMMRWHRDKGHSQRRSRGERGGMSYASHPQPELLNFRGRNYNTSQAPPNNSPLLFPHFRHIPLRFSRISPLVLLLVGLVATVLSLYRCSEGGNTVPVYSCAANSEIP